ncbi:MAG: HAMP domain-containing protein [Anaerolineales bacterium]|nr:HAMP domain-containing protein [Anaerolineales bacterium]
MTIELTLLGNRPYLELPHNWIEWTGWLSLLIVTLVWGWNEFQKALANPRTKSKSFTRFTWAWWIILLVLIPLTGLFLVFRLPPGDVLPLPGTPTDPQGPALVLLALLPLTLAAGFLGALPAFCISLLSGMVHALWETHSLFTPLVFCLLGVALAAALQQPYRTRSYQLLRKPLPAAAAIAVGYPVLSLFLHSLTYPSSLANRLDYALSHLPADWQSMAGQLLIAGLFAQVIAWMFPSRWGCPDPSQPSPVERRLYIRFLFGMAPLVLVLLIALAASIWVISGRIANQTIKNQMSSTASAAADAIPYYLQTGQSLIRQIALDEPWLSGSSEQLNFKLQQELRLVPFFSQLFVLNTRLQTIAGYPFENYTDSYPSQDELDGITAALSGIPAQYYTLPPASQGENALVTFLTPLINDQTGAVEGVLIGRSVLEVNPLIQPALSGLKSFAAQGGQSILLDQNQRILYHTDRILILEPYTGPTAEEPSFFDDHSASSARRWVYYYPSTGSPWSVVLTIPARLVEQSAMTIAAPLYLVVLLLTFVSVLLLRLGLRRITASLDDLASESNRIANGQLDHPMAKSGEDEVGQLRRSFEQMRASLKARLDELNLLLLVSQGVAASLDMEDAVQPVLESALKIGASSARVVLTPEAMPQIQTASTRPSQFGQGPSNEAFSSLDEQVLALAQQQNRIALNNLGRVRMFTFKPDVLRPEALLALALRQEKVFYGVLWLGFDQPHQFTEDEIRFISTLARQTELAATNTRLFLTSEIGRQQMESILDSSPDPVLVTDHQGKLLLANPAAWQVLKLKDSASQGKPIQQVISQPGLVDLLTATSNDKLSAEITLPDQRVYLATSSSVLAGGSRVGRICLLRDITHFKNLDSLKSEFVSTVSHDLRNPLTLMRGYATMLEMVGELNEQQSSYLRKILTSIEDMSRLVNNLLDLGRIEAGVGLQLEMTPIGEVANRVITNLQPLAVQKQIQLRLRSRPPCPCSLKLILGCCSLPFRTSWTTASNTQIRVARWT